MYSNFKILFRNLFCKSIYTWINIIGLGISLTAAIFMLLWVQDEWRYDKQYERVDDMYILFDHSIKNGSEDYNEYLPVPLARAVQAEVAEVEAATVLGYEWFLAYLDYDGKKYFKNKNSDFIRTDSSFFRVFDMEFVEGSLEYAFPDKNAIILTDELATILFGNESALGKTLKGNTDEVFHVTAVVKKAPQNSILEFKAILSFEESTRMARWGQWTSRCFVLLNPNADVKTVAEKITETHERHSKSFSVDYPYVLQPLAHYHLYNADGSDSGIKDVRLFTFTAVALLVIACINYVNLVTARARRRAKEVGLRKIVGASRFQLLVQLLSETVLLLLASMVLATLLLYLLTPYYNQLTGKELRFSIFNLAILRLYLANFLFIILLAGLYPAIFLSSFNPLETFKAKTTERQKIFSFRRILIVLQFACSGAFILATIVVNSQQHYMQTKDLGYNRENVFTLDVLSNPNTAKHFEAFRQELLQHSEIVDAAMSEQNILNIGNFSDFTWDGASADAHFSTTIIGISQNFLGMLSLQVVEGRGFSGTPSDSLCLLVNEAFVRMIGTADPLNTTINVGGWGLEGKITGVIKDFNFRHMSMPIQAIVMYLVPYTQAWTIYVKVAKGKASEALAVSEKVWKKFNPDFPFDYRFMDDTFDEMYRSDIRIRNLFNTFSIIAILVSCLGLFGLVTYTAETRTKEIGIRKTLGANVGSIVAMLSKEFIVLVGIAVAVGFPVAYYLIEKFLQSYAYRISITWWMILTAVLVVLILVILTVSAQALRAARANPVKAIKTE